MSNMYHDNHGARRSGGVHRHERPPSRLPRQHVLLLEGQLQGDSDDQDNDYDDV